MRGNFSGNIGKIYVKKKKKRKKRLNYLSLISKKTNDNYSC